jgi:hypothetical protein
MKIEAELILEEVGFESHREPIAELFAKATFKVIRRASEQYGQVYFGAIKLAMHPSLYQELLADQQGRRILTLTIETAREWKDLPAEQQKRLEG